MPRTKRVLVGLTVPEGTDKHELATDLDHVLDGADPTVWEWQEFFEDIESGTVSPHHDGTEVTT